MTLIGAALEVLGATTDSLTANQLLERAPSRGLLMTKGQTPERALSAALNKDANAEAPRVKRLSNPGPGRAARGSVRWTLER